MLIYTLILYLRHLFYDKGWIKSVPLDCPSICVGNVTVGGTGKTPMVEHIIRTLKEDEAEPEEGFYGSLFGAPIKNVAVISRGYRRKTRGFQEVVEDGTAEQFGDEPLQVKRKFPDTAVVVDSDRVEAASILTHSYNGRKKVKVDRPLPLANVIILDDAFQHRRVKASGNIVLTTYSRPFFKDRLMPFGRLRDLPSRVREADVVVVTKCPPYLDEWERSKWARNIGINLFDTNTCSGINADGKKQILLFSTTVYDKMKPVFKEGDARYTHSKFAILFTGIANDSALKSQMEEQYKLVYHRNFPDHHFFSQADINRIDAEAKRNQISLVLTTEKDAQRLMDADSPSPYNSHVLNISDDLRRRTFYVPIRLKMLTDREQEIFKEFVNGI